MEPEDITEEMFEGIDLVHLTGVFLAIDPKNLAIAKKVLKIADKKEIQISFDPNIRLKLWTLEQAKAAGIGSDLNKAYAAGGFNAAVELTQKYMQKSIQ